MTSNRLKLLRQSSALDESKKTLRSRSPNRSHASEKLYVIKGFSYKGTPIYTKGRFGRDHGEQVFYVLISSKIDSP